VYLGFVLLFDLAQIAVITVKPGELRQWVRDMGESFVVAFLASTFLAFVVAFSSLYWTLSLQDPQSFSEPISRVDSVYFTLTTLSTTGFGDIHPVSGTAKVFVCLQIVSGFLLVTIVLTTIVSRLLSEDRHDSTKDSS